MWLWVLVACLLQAQAKPPPPPVQRPIVEVRVSGNVRVDREAILRAARARPGVRLTQPLLRQDVRAIWRLGVFEDVRADVTWTARGPTVTFVVRERPVVRRFYIAGNDQVSVRDINAVLDVRRGEFVDPAKLQRNVVKIRDLYEQRGHYLASVRYDPRPVAQGQVDVTFRIREEERVLVGQVRFVGNRAFSDAQLRDVITTRTPTLLSPVTGAGLLRSETVERDAVLLRTFYFDRGYVNAQIGPPRVEISADGRYGYVTFSINEGEQYRVGEVSVGGELIAPEAELVEALGLRPGELFNRSTLTRGIEAINARYRNAGFAYANITPETEVREDQRQVDLRVEIERGPVVTIERIEIVGNRKTRDRVIRRELRLAEGQQYSQEALDASRRRVLALGYFRDVQVATRRGSSDRRMIVTLSVTERPTGNFQAGVGYSSSESLVFQAQVTQQNLFGRGQTLALNAQLSGVRRLFLLQFQEPYFLNTPITFGFSAYNTQRGYLGFVRSANGGTVTWGYLFSDAVRGFFIYTLEDVETDVRGGGLFSPGARNPVPGAAGLLQSGLTSAPQIAFLYDTRNDRFITTSGQYHNVSFEVADPALGSDNVFARAEATGRYFRPLGPLLLRARAQAGIVVSRAALGVPLFERYFLGGIFDVRGFRPRSLGPQIRVVDPGVPGLLDLFTIGGNAQAFGNVELEVPLVPPLGIRGVVFVDGGNAFNLEDRYCGLAYPGAPPSRDPCPGGLQLDSFRTSWGLGARWFSPIGPLRFEWGFPFDPLPGEESSVFEFTIGNSF